VKFFNLVTTNGLGEDRDTVQLPKVALGQANVAIHVNPLSGNLFVQDHRKTWIDVKAKLQIGMVYNSQAKDAWRLSLGEYIEHVAGVLNTENSSLKVNETDGHETLYLFDKARRCYVAEGSEDGASTLTFDNSEWVKWIPGSGEKYFYDAQGRLRKTTLLDKSVSYTYNAAGLLNLVVGESGQRIEIDYQDKIKQIFLIDPNALDQSKKLIASYHFDTHGLLRKTIIPVSENENYEISYQYDEPSGLLSSIQQTDTTAVSFSCNDKERKITKLSCGKENYALQYSPEETVLQDGKSDIKINKNKQGLLAAYTDSDQTYEREYDIFGRCKTIRYEDGTQRKYAYDQLGFRSKITDRNKDEHEFFHDSESGRLLKSTLKSANIYYIYDKKGQLICLVNPIGKVCVYDYDNNGNQRSKKEYLEALYPVAKLIDKDIITLVDLLKWQEKNKNTAFALTEWNYNFRGQITKEIVYANIEEGKGILDAYAAQTFWEWNAHDECVKEIKTLNALEKAETTTEYDGLLRKIKFTDPLNQVITYKFDGANEIEHDQATDIDEVTFRNSAGQVDRKIRRANLVLRETKYLFDANGKSCGIVHSDGNKSYFLLDAMGRKKFSINAKKQLTEYGYDANANLIHTIRYEEPQLHLDEDEIINGLWVPNAVGRRSIHSSLYDAENRLRYTVDGENYVIEYIYDSQKNLIEKCEYATPLSDTEEKQRCVKGKMPAVKVSSADRIHRYFYDLAGRKIGEQLPAGQLVEYRYNAKGDLLEEIHYASPSAPCLTWNPAQNKKGLHDKIDRYTRDKRGITLSHYDAEDIETTYEHDAGGRLTKTKRADNLAIIEYDLLDRPKKEKQATGLTIEKRYHGSGQVNFERQSSHLEEVSEDAIVRTQYQHIDAFGQLRHVVIGADLSFDDVADIFTKNDIEIQFAGDFRELVTQALLNAPKTNQKLKFWDVLTHYLLEHQPHNEKLASIVFDAIKKNAMSIILSSNDDNKTEQNTLAFLLCLCIETIITKRSWHSYLGGNLLIERLHAKEGVSYNINVIPERLKDISKFIRTAISTKITDIDKEYASWLEILEKISSTAQQAIDNPTSSSSAATKGFYGELIEVTTVKNNQSDLQESLLALPAEIELENTYSDDGLLLTSRDAEGNRIVHYYDALRRPYLIINPRGVVTEFAYDNLSDGIVRITTFANFLPPNLFPTFTGGFITLALLTKLENLSDSKTDATHSVNFDRRGLTVFKVDEESFSEAVTYNAFGEIELRRKDVKKENGKTIKVTTDAYQYDKNGRKLLTILDVCDSNLREETIYLDENATVIHINVKGDRETLSHDKLGRVIKRIDALGHVHRQKWDALSRLEVELDAMKQLTTYSYRMYGRIVIITTPIVSQTMIKNVFDEIHLIKRKIGKLAEEFSTNRDYKGRVTRSIGPQGVTRFVYSAVGKLKEQTDPSGAVTLYEHDVAGNLQKVTEDAQGIGRVTNYQHDAYGRVVGTCDGNGVWTKHIRDRRGLEVKTIIDESSMQLTTTKEYDGLGNLVSEKRGNVTNEDLYHVVYEFDSLGKEISRCIDPDGLHLVSEFRRDKLGNISTSIDEEGNIIRYFYDACAQVRFIIDAEDVVTEKQYNANGQCVAVRRYAARFDLSKLTKQPTSIDEVAGSVNPSDSDKVSLFFFDKNSHCKFKLQLFKATSDTYQAIISEYQFDQAGRETKQINYASFVTVVDPTALSTASLEQLVPSIADSQQDRVVFRWYDAAAQERFTIHGDGRVIEKRYDVLCKVVTEICYASAWPNISELDTLNLTDVMAKMPSRPLLDRITHYFYDTLGRKIYDVSPEGAVKKYQHDLNDNIVLTCLFKKPIDITLNRSNIFTHLESQKFIIGTDEVTITEYDNNNQILSVTHAHEKDDVAESYTRDPLGQVREFKAKNKQIWRMNYDRAKRMTEEVSPVVHFAEITSDEHGNLHPTIYKKPVKTTTKYSVDGNPQCKSIIYGDGLPYSRHIKITHNADGQIVDTETAGVVIDDPAKPASITEFPIIKTSLLTKKIYNTNKNKVAEQDEEGNWKFFVYNNIGRLTFEVDSLGYVIKNTYNVFGELTEERHYATPLVMDFQLFTATGIDAISVEKLLQADPNDRVTTIKHDTRGNVERIVKSEINFYTDNQLAVGNPVTRKQYNLFGECIYEASQISSNSWNEKWTWYNNDGHVIAEVNGDLHLTTYARSVTGKVTHHSEFALPLKSKPQIGMTYTELLTLQGDKNKADKHTRYEYLADDTLKSHIEEGVVAQELVFSKEGKPNLVDSPATDLVTSFEYDEMGKKTVTTYPDGAKKHVIYDANGVVVGEADVTRKGLTPYVVYVPDAFGEVVLKCVLKSGKEGFKDLDSFELQNNDQLELIKMDTRGLTQVKQDAEGNQFHFTYTASKKLARMFYQRTQLARKMDNIGLANESVATEVSHHLDEQQTRYDKLGRIVQKLSLRDGVGVSAHYSNYNAFGECIGEGIDGVNWPLYREFDRAGHLLRTNSQQGVAVIMLRDLRGEETLQLQSPSEDLSAVNISQFADILNWPPTRIEKTETIRNFSGYPVSIKAPLWFVKNVNGRPTRLFLPDRWGNILQETNSKGDVENREYNHHQKEVLHVGPEVDVVDEKHVRKKIRPVTKTGYNTRGTYVGTTDANGHTHGVILDEAQQWLVNVLADGLHDETRELDIFSNQTTLTDARTKTWKFEHNRLNLLVLMRKPSGNLYRYQYDEMQNRNVEIDPQNAMTCYNFDLNNRIVDTFMPRGHHTQVQYHHTGKEVKVTLPDGAQLTTERDFFGHENKRTDLAGEVYNSTYDFKFQLKSQSSLQGNHGTHIRWKRQTDADKTLHTIYYEYGKMKKIAHEYLCGLLTLTTDAFQYKNTVYKHNTEGEVERMEIYQFADVIRVENTDSTNGLAYVDQNLGVMLRVITSEIDALGNMIKFTNKFLTATGYYGYFHLTREYDAVRNLCHISVRVDPAGYSTRVSPEKIFPDAWYSHDEADRVLVSNGALVGTEVVSTANQGIKLIYENGWRKAEKMNGDSLVTDITYTDDGELEVTSAPGDLTQRTYRPGSLVAEYRETYVQDGKRHVVVKKPLYDINGWQVADSFTRDIQLKVRVSHEVSTTVITNHAYYNVPIKLTTTATDDIDGKLKTSISDFTVSDYEKFDTLLPRTVHGELSVGKGNNKPEKKAEAQSSQFYDPNQMISYKVNTVDENFWDGKDNVKDVPVWFDTTDSMMLSKHNPLGFTEKKNEPGRETGRIYSHYFFHDTKKQMLASIAETFILDDQKATNLAHQSRIPAISELVIPSFIRSLVPTHAPPKTDAHKHAVMIDEITYPSFAAQVHIVQAGETLASIASDVLGDAEFARRLAIENGWLSNQPLKPRQILHIPQCFAAKYTASSHRPYHEFVSVITGSFMPFLRILPPHVSNHRSFFHILVKVIAAAIVFSVAPYLGGLLASSLISGLGIVTGTVSGSMISAVLTTVSKGVMGIVVDAALQGVAIKIGAQDSFSWQEAIGSGIAVGVNAAIIGDAAKFSIMQITEKALRISSSAVTTQLVEMAACLRSHFDGGAVGIQVAATLIAYKTDEKIIQSLGQKNSATIPALNAAHAVTDAALGSTIHHTPMDVRQMAAHALGTTAVQTAESKMVSAQAKRNVTPASKSQPTQAKAPPPLTMGELKNLASAESVARHKLPAATLDVSGAAHKLSEVNRARMQHGLFGRESVAIIKGVRDTFVDVAVGLGSTVLHADEVAERLVIAGYYSGKMRLGVDYDGKAHVYFDGIRKEMVETGRNIKKTLNEMGNTDPDIRGRAKGKVIGNVLTLFVGELAAVRGVRGVGFAEVGESGWLAAEKALDTLQGAQAKNLQRFIDKLPKNSENIRVRAFLDNGKVFQADSPASNIPGSFARYEKQIDVSSNTVLYTKTTFGSNGEIVHVAPKFPSGPKIYPDFDVRISPGLSRR